MTMMTAMRMKALAKARPAFAAEELALSSLKGVYNLETNQTLGNLGTAE